MAVSGRLYTVSFSNVTLSAVQDLFLLIAGSGKGLGLHSIELGQITGVTVANLRLRIRMHPVTVTNGSGGTAPTPQKTNNNDAAATFTARANDTTQSSSSGTTADMVATVVNTINGFVWYPPVPGRPLVCPVSGAIAISLDTAPSSLVFNGSVTVEEFP